MKLLLHLSLLLLALLPLVLTEDPASKWSDYLPSFLKKERVEVEIPQGKLSGVKRTSPGGQEFFGFEGIPYAKSPEGWLRFKKPRPHGQWEGTLDATRNIKCLQQDLLFGLGVEGQEDCLVVNVYTPELPGEDESAAPKRPVMVWIHGGGFWVGSGKDVPPAFAMDHDIVLVTLNYRLGPLGFLSSGDDDLPGNLGLWDQNLALIWIQKNIAYFGGDRKKVTIFGESAGSFSVFSHLMTPHSKGLFHAAIAQSGVANSAWVATDKHPAFFAKSFASKLGCDADKPTKEMVECMKQLPAENLYKPEVMFMFDQLEHYPHAYQPVVDNQTSNPFFPKDPYDTLQEGSFNKVPLIYGMADGEGLLLQGSLLKDSTYIDQMEKEWEESLAIAMFGRHADEITTKDRKRIDQIQQEYFKGNQNPTREERLEVLTEIFEDSHFMAIALHSGRLFAEKSDKPVYEYMYSHLSSSSVFNAFGMPVWKYLSGILLKFAGIDLLPLPPKTAHGDFQLMTHGFDLGIHVSAVHSEEDAKVNANIWHMWSDFAKTHDPTPGKSPVKWEPVTKEKPQHMNIGPQLSMSSDSTEMSERLRRWNKIWADAPPRLHNSLESPTWKDQTIYRKAVAEEKKSEL